MLGVEHMMMTSLATLLVLVTLTSAATGGDVPQAHHHRRHHNNLRLYQDVQQHQRHDAAAPQSGTTAPEFYHGNQLIMKSMMSPSQHNLEGFLHKDKKFNQNNSVSSLGEISSVKSLKEEEPSPGPGEFSPEEYKSAKEDKPVASSEKIVSSVIKRHKKALRMPSYQEDIKNIKRNTRTSATNTETRHEESFDHRPGTKGAHTSDLEGFPCTSDADCYLVNFNDTFSYHGNIVHAPYCEFSNSSSSSSSEGYCTCGEYCVSRSTDSVNSQLFYYCGPCGRMGSTCSDSAPCNHTLSTCPSGGGYCSCHSGEFYDLYYCMIPYYGYEKALQVAIATCIFVAVCLLAATIYSSLYRRPQGRIHPYLLRLLMRRANQGTRESPPGDTPPKYDDVVDEPPSYQQALELEQGNDGQEGENNLAFEGDNKHDNNNDKDNNDDNKTNNNDGGGRSSSRSNSISNGGSTINNNDSKMIRNDSRLPGDELTITVVATKSSTNNDNNNASDGDTNSNETDVIAAPDEPSRQVARHTGAIPKQKSLPNSKQHKAKRTSQKQQQQQTAPAVVEEGCSDSQTRSDDGVMMDEDGVDRCSDDGVSKGSIAEQPITLPLRGQVTSL